ncbi:TetR/AcrR family transcriptional regulator [Nocardia sp. NPDC058058]|uniref:TetR/AcrR family transcriptional regulator n=1 Tax=Nocardia sp. NPDC058058 TaxID=3346317 RepID=UPI0036DCE7EE
MTESIEAAASDSAPPAGPRVTKRRGETRRRMLDAAYEVLAEVGFGRSKPERICERAGYTRGAFYSQFNSMDELFLALWEEKAAQLLADVTAVLDREPVTDIREVRRMVDHVLDAIPMDEKWFRITLEFAAHALRNPELRPVMVAREEAIIATLLPVVETLLERVGRKVTDREAFGQALVAVQDGTMTQCLMEPDKALIRERRADLFMRVVLSFSEAE